MLHQRRQQTPGYLETARPAFSSNNPFRGSISSSASSWNMGSPFDEAFDDTPDKLFTPMGSKTHRSYSGGTPPRTDTQTRASIVSGYSLNEQDLSRPVSSVSSSSWPNQGSFARYVYHGFVFVFEVSTWLGSCERVSIFSWIVGSLGVNCLPMTTFQLST
jgi:hypothetical protein